MTPTEAARILRGWAGTYRICAPPDACPDCIRTIKAVRMGVELLEREAAAEEEDPAPIAGLSTLPGWRASVEVRAAAATPRHAHKLLAARLRATARKLEE